jgi:hypothetical protein
VRHRAWARRPGHAGELLAGRQLQRDLPERAAGRVRSREAVPPVLVPRRGAKPRRADDPGSIHEGGELGYSLSHAYGAAFDNPDLIVACVVGDGEAETWPLATSWHANKFINPALDGAVLPILHLNGWKIANPAVLARIPDGELDALLRGYGYEPSYVSGHEPSVMHQEMAAAVDDAIDRIRAIQHHARTAAGFPGGTRGHAGP